MMVRFEPGDLLRLRNPCDAPVLWSSMYDMEAVSYQVAPVDLVLVLSWDDHDYLFVIVSGLVGFIDLAKLVKVS